MPIPYDPNDTPLSSVLGQLGYTIQDVRDAKKIMKKEILDNGTLLFTGDAFEVWKWLQSTGRIYQIPVEN
jgi:hypothetical protein